MISRLRARAGEPLGEHDRPRLAAICLAVIATGATIMLATRADPPPRPVPIRSPAPAAPPATTPAASSGVSSGRGDRRISSADLRQAKRAARRFLTGYLAFTYGRRPARAVTHATPHLRRSLAADPPRVRTRDRRRRARIELIQNDESTTSATRVLALVSDGRRRYTVAVTLQRRDGRWLAAQVGR